MKKKVVYLPVLNQQKVIANEKLSLDYDYNWPL